MARKAAIRHPDFTIVFRKDRNGYEGWHSGKAEAFRPTVEKVNLFFQKKYGKIGALLVDVLPSGSIVREYSPPVVDYNQPEAEPAKIAKAHAAAAVKTAKAKAKSQPKAEAKAEAVSKGKRIAPVLEPEDFEDTDLDPLSLL